MNFYAEFADRYDDLAWPDERREAEASFFRTVFDRHDGGIETVLDCACGTGHHVLLFDERLGLDAIGSDVSPEMVDEATTLADERGTDVRFETVDFRHLTDVFDRDTFDAVVCVGNSLPHVQSESAIRTALESMAAMLADGGLLVVGTRNYDKLLVEQPDYLPIAATETTSFVYSLEYHQDEIVFEVLAHDLDSNELDVFSTTYNPIRKATLDSLLEETGFDQLACYGDSELRPADLESDDTYTVVCQKVSQ